MSILEITNPYGTRSGFRVPSHPGTLVKHIVNGEQQVDKHGRMLYRRINHAGQEMGITTLPYKPGWKPSRSKYRPH